MRRGLCGLRVLSPSPSNRVSSSETTFTAICPGDTASTTSLPKHAALTRSVNSCATLKLTSALSRAELTSFRAGAMFSGVSFESPRRSRRALVSFSVKALNTESSVEHKLRHQASRDKNKKQYFTDNNRIFKPAESFNYNFNDIS